MAQSAPPAPVPASPGAQQPSQPTAAAPAENGAAAVQTPPPADPNTPPSEDQLTTIRATTNEVNVVFTVTDKHGKRISDLKQNDFRVLDDHRHAGENSQLPR